MNPNILVLDGPPLKDYGRKVAVANARKAAMTHPIYAQLAAGTVKSPYNIALSDWFHPPIIHQVTQAAGLIRVRASRNAKIAGVRVLILNENGKIIKKEEHPRNNILRISKLQWINLLRRAYNKCK